MQPYSFSTFYARSDLLLLFILLLLLNYYFHVHIGLYMYAYLYVVMLVPLFDFNDLLRRIYRTIPSF